MGGIGFIIVLAGVWVTPPKRRSMLAVGLVILGFVVMSLAGWRPLQ